MLKDQVVSVVSENCHITVYLHTIFCKHSDSPDIGVSQDTCNVRCVNFIVSTVKYFHCASFISLLPCMRLHVYKCTVYKCMYITYHIES